MESYKFNDLVEIMKRLRVECPWDKEQTHKSIRRNFIEETYEAVEAIDDENVELLREELGDVMLQVVFHSQIAHDNDKFDIDDVCDGICKKLIFRHPHIFSDAKVSGANEVLSNWDSLKKIEKGQKTKQEVLASVSKSLPSLIRMEKVYSKALKEGIETSEVSNIQAIAKEIEKGDLDQIPEMIFNLTKICKQKSIDLEQLVHNYVINYIESVKK